MVGVVSAAVLLSALGGAVLALAQPALDPNLRASWALAGFEIVISVAAVLGILAALGKFTDGPALALACVAGTILVGSGLGWQGAGRQLMGHPLLPLLGARVVAAMIIGGVAVWSVLERDRRSWKYAIVGGACLAGVIAIAALTVLPIGQRLIIARLSASPTGQLVAAILGMGVVIALSATAVQQLVKAFEFGRPRGPGVTSPSRRA